MICTDPSCGCGIVSDSLTVTGSGAPGSPYRLETNAFSIVTSLTRPLTPTVGQFAWETDTQRQVVWTGADWLIVAGAMPGWNVTRKSSDAVLPVLDSISTDVPFLNEVEDSDVFHTGTAAAVSIPASLGGDYIVSAGVQFSGGGATGYRLLVIDPTLNTSQANEADTIRSWAPAGVSTSNQFLSVTKKVRLEGGATVLVRVFQSNGTSIDVLRAYFTGAMVRHLPTLT
jgi:hypothetical protein